MKYLVVILAILAPALARADSFSYETGDCASGGCAQFEQFLHTNANELADAIGEIYGLYQYADPNEAGTTTGGIQEAVNRCGSGVAGNDPSNGCTVKLACGDVPISTQVTVGGNSTATAKSGVRIMGCGGGSVNSAAVTNPSVGGTTIVSSVADYGFKFQACSSCALENFGYNGTDTSTGLLDIAESSASWPSSHVAVMDVDVERTTGYVVRTNAVSQVDQIFVYRSTFRNVGGCFQQNYSQNVLTMFLQSECANLKSSGSKIGFDIVTGTFHFQNSFWGTSGTVTGQTGFRLGTAASVFSVRGSHLEMVTTGNTLIDDNTGAGSGHSQGNNIFDGNQVTVVGASNVCFDVATRGAWTVTNNHLQQTEACTSTFNMSNATDISNGHLLKFTEFGNVDNVFGTAGQVWDPTLGTGVVRQILSPEDIGSTVQAFDADLADLADGSLTGSKIGSGLDGTTITAGTVADARVASTITRDTDWDTAAEINAATLDQDFLTETGSYSIVTTGTIQSATSVTVSASSTASPLASQMLGVMYYYTSGSGVDVTLPAASAGLSACFYDANGGGVITLDAAAGDQIVLDGVGVGTADAIDSAGNLGDFICLLAIDSTTWINLGRSGTWVDGGAD